MPGHLVSPQEESLVTEYCRELERLVDEHDVVFLLTDTRESRWLPTLLCAAKNKVKQHLEPESIHRNGVEGQRER